MFQHGTEADVATYFANVKASLRPGGLFFLRVNSVATQIIRRHTVIERTASGGITIQYDEGPKQDLAVHFYSRAELAELTADGFEDVMPPREQIVARTPPQTGCWVQWEAVWRCR